MHVSQAKRILARARPERTLFHYFKDRYALLLLSWAADSGSRISDLRGGPLANLLRKPTVKRLLAGVGDGRVCPDWFLSHWPGLPYCYVLTLGLWGHECKDVRWNQTSRKGVTQCTGLLFPSPFRDSPSLRSS